MNKSESKLGYILIALAGISWAFGGFFVLKLSNYGIDAATIAFLCQITAAILLSLRHFARYGIEGFKLNKDELKLVIAYGLIGKGFMRLAYDISITYVGMSTAVILMYTSPIFTIFMARIFFKEGITSQKLIAIMINFVGTILVITGGDLTNLQAAPIGLLLGTFAGFLYAASTLVARVSGDTMEPMKLVTFTLITSAIPILPFADLGPVVPLLTDWKFLLLVMLYGFTNGPMANSLFLIGANQNVDTAKIPVVSSIEVPVAALIGYFIIGEDLNVISIIGIVLMLISIVFMNVRLKDR